MRQLTAPGRCAVWIATALVAAASAGCMSVSDDGGRPAPSKPPHPRGAAAEPDGGGAAPGGAGGHGRAGMGGASPSGSAGAEGEIKGAEVSPGTSEAPSGLPPKGGAG
ncbi:hypothetical protein ACWGI8_29650, partial [Streptomyces sp. NPDC054841]